MSSQKGNVRRSRPPKHKNQTAFKNNLHDTSKVTKDINGLKLTSLCQRCDQIIQWKIKYKKYRPLTQPKSCIKCNQKTIKLAYYTICIPCSSILNVCAKCGQSDCDILASTQQNQEEINRQFESALRDLKERERRTLLRCAQNKTDPGNSPKTTTSDQNASPNGATASRKKPSDICSESSDYDASDSAEEDDVDGSDCSHKED